MTTNVVPATLLVGNVFGIFCADIVTSYWDSHEMIQQPYSGLLRTSNVMRSTSVKTPRSIADALEYIDRWFVQGDNV